MITKALIAWGGWEGHGPEGCAVVVAEILKARGVQCTVGQGTSAFVQHDLSDFQVIVPVFTMTDIEDHEVDAVCRAVRGGVGLAGFHGGMGDSFRTSIAWQHMVGGQFVGHPRDFRDYRVDIRQPDHGICRGLGSFDLHSEQYYMQTDPRINVLATTTFHETGLSECDGVTIPNVWTTTYGRGRIFYSAFGHSPADFAHPQIRNLFERGALWAANKDL